MSCRAEVARRSAARIDWICSVVVVIAGGTGAVVRRGTSRRSCWLRQVRTGGGVQLGLELVAQGFAAGQRGPGWFSRMWRDDDDLDRGRSGLTTHAHCIEGERSVGRGDRACLTADDHLHGQRRGTAVRTGGPRCCDVVRGEGAGVVGVDDLQRHRRGATTVAIGRRGGYRVSPDGARIRTAIARRVVLRVRTRRAGNRDRCGLDVTAGRAVVGTGHTAAAYRDDGRNRRQHYA